MTSEAQVPDLPTLRDLYIKDRLIKGPFGTATPEAEFLAPPPPASDPDGRKAWLTRRSDLCHRVVERRKCRLGELLFPKETIDGQKIKDILNRAFWPVTSVDDYSSRPWPRLDPQVYDAARTRLAEPSMVAIFTLLEAIKPASPPKIWPWMGGLVFQTQDGELIAYVGGDISFRKGEDAHDWILRSLENDLTCQAMVDNNGEQSPAWQILRARLETATQRELETAQKDFDQAVAVSPDGTAIVKPNLVVVQDYYQWHLLHFNRPGQHAIAVKMVELAGHTTRRIKANATAERLQPILREEIIRREEIDGPKQPTLLVFQDGYQAYIPTRPQRDKDSGFSFTIYETLTLVGDKHYLPWGGILGAPSDGWALGMDWPNGIAAWTGLPLDDEAWRTAKQAAEQAAREEPKTESAAPTTGT